VREAYPDHTQFDAKSEYHDPSAKPEAPRWFMVDCRLQRPLERQIPLEELKSHGGPGGALADMALLRLGRLSVQPVTREQWEFVLALEAGPRPRE
jgi:predicted RNA-binding protein with PUA-like domain